MRALSGWDRRDHALYPETWLQWIPDSNLGWFLSWICVVSLQQTPQFPL